MTFAPSPDDTSSRDAARRVEPVRSPDQARDQAILEEAAARRRRGEQVIALRAVTDRRLRIYSKVEAGLAWHRDTSSRAVFSLAGLGTILALVSTVLIVLVVLAAGSQPEERSMFAVGFVIVGVVWIVAAQAMFRSVRSARARHRSGLPAPIPNSDHL